MLPPNAVTQLEADRVFRDAEYRLGVWASPKRWLKILLTVAAATATLVTYWMFRRYEG